MEASLERSLAQPGEHVHLGCGHEQAPFARLDLPAEVAEDGEGGGEVALEEGLGVGLAADGEEGDVKGGHDGDPVDGEAEPGADDAHAGSVGELVGCEAGGFPARAEADVREADGHPDEEEGECGQGQEPAEDVAGFAGLAEVGDEAEAELEERGPEGSALTVDVLEESGGHSALSEGLDRSG